MATNFDAAWCAAQYKKLGRCLVRTDFPAGAEGWKAFCEHRIRKYQAEAAKANETVAFWTKMMAGEHMVQAEEKLKEVARLEAKLAKAKAEVTQK